MRDIYVLMLVLKTGLVIVSLKQIGGFMQHCCKFKADDIYFLNETNLFVFRKLTIGFCPICLKPVAEVYQVRFDGIIDRVTVSGMKAKNLVSKLKDDILYSMQECNYQKFKSKPYGWKYGINKTVKNKGKEIIKQYACDFYGNKEIVKTL